MSQNFENAMRERFEQRFKNWNNGYDAWLDWCETRFMNRMRTTMSTAIA